MSPEPLGPPSPLLDAALSILADGKPRTADEILTEGKTRGLFAATEDRKQIYTALSQYVQRTLGRGRKPAIVENADRTFVLNRPRDDWPQLDLLGLPPLGAPRNDNRTTQAIAALQTASAGSDPTAFEIAVCDAFTALGFETRHVGGNGAPDGYADAPLGRLTYRIMIECKLSRDSNISQSDAVAEAAKYRDAYHGRYCILVAPSFDDETTFTSELATHAVTACSVDDLVRALSLGVNVAAWQELLPPGVLADTIDDYAWSVVHGAQHRLRVVASILLRDGLAQQQTALRMGSPQDAPRLTVDVGMALLDAAVAEAGGTTGATPAEVEAAMQFLASPFIARALWEDDARQAIVILPA